MYRNIKNILLILNHKQKIKSLILVILILGGTLIELICLFSIYEIVKYSTSILTSNSADGNNYVETLFSLIGFSYEIKTLSIILIFLYLFKFLYILSINRFQYKFTNSVKVYLNVLLLKKYLSKNYMFFLDNNPAKLLRNVDSEVSQFILGCLLQMIILFTELLFLIALVVSLTFVNFKIVLFIMISFLIIVILYALIIKKKLLIEGNKRVELTGKLLKNLTEAFHGVKNIKIFNASNYFLKSVEKNSKELAKTTLVLSVLSQVPKNGLEMFAVFMISIMILNQDSMNSLDVESFSAISFFVLAAFKLLPSVSKIIMSFQTMRFSQASVEIIKKEVTTYRKQSLGKINDQKKLKKISLKKNISLNNISFRYNKRSDYLFKGINLKISKGDVVGIYGESGTGKSTLIDILLGLLKPTKGNLKIDDIKITNNNRNSWLNSVGYVPQKIFLTDDTLLENIAFGQDITEIDKTKAYKSIKQSELESLVTSKGGLKRKLGQHGSNVSGGQLQRIGIARSLYKSAEIYVFDESTSSLDKETEKKMLDVIKKISKNKSCIIVSHNINNLKYCNKIFCLKNKKLNTIKLKNS